MITEDEEFATCRLQTLNPSGILSMTVILDEVVTVIRKSPAMEVRNNLGELLNEVQYRGDRIVITKAGKPIAALVDYRLFERIRLMDREFETLTDELAKAYKGLDSHAALSEIDEAVKSARRR